MNESQLRTKFHAAIGDDDAPVELRGQTRIAVKRAAEDKRPRLQWVPGAIAAALALAIISSFLAISVYKRSHNAPATTRPTPIASPIPPAERGPIPAGTPVVIYARSAPDGIYATSWNGDLYRIPNLSGGSGGAGFQSPDGSRLSLGGLVYDTTTGAVLAHLPDGIMTWADDSRHVCLATPLPGAGSPTQISYGLPGSNLTTLGKFGTWAVQVPGAGVLACSANSNRVVVANVGGENDTSDVWVLNATSGAIEFHRTYLRSTKTNGNVGTFVVASPHGDYLAETDGMTGTATIRRVANDTVVAQLQHMEVLGFSWNGILVLATPRQADFSVVNTTMADPVIVDWTTGATIWQSPAGSFLSGRVHAQPGGEALAVGMAVGDRRFGVWLIGADGRGRQVDRDIYPY